jgi:twitching motility protein PilT
LIEDKEKTKLLRDTIQQGYVSYGMQTFDQSLLQLTQKKLITFDEALRQSSNPDDFKLKFSGISSTSDMSWEDFEDKGGDGTANPAEEGTGEEKLQLDRI